MKKSAYQKLKEENKILKQELHTLVNDPDSMKAVEIEMKYRFLADLENAVFAGTPTMSLPEYSFNNPIACSLLIPSINFDKE